ncbi:MAG: 2-succinyl-6-hydroxy-2,4-cyclohexadiene-1-carboxylate synthase [Synechococcales bacterium]|nr:2-succinyl-6-hydroxy-2,4-cyclohexadiene-1-carboxylate synthase [Synechococcales bacterium]
MPHLTTGAYQFHYQWWGDRSQPIILFLHGFMGRGDDFAAAIAALGGQFASLTLDLPGHGQTQVTGDSASYALAPMAAGVLSLLDGLEVPRCGLFGYSLGGRLALYLALHFPDRFAWAVLESASPGLATVEEREGRSQRDEHLAQDLETGDFRKFLTRWYDQPLFASLKAHPSFDTMYQRRLVNRPAELAQSLRHASTGRQPSLWPPLAHGQIPLYLLVGDRDEKFCAINRRMAQLCPTAQLHILPGRGHNLHLEDPQGVATLVRQWGQKR